MANIQTQTYQGLPGGMNTAAPAHEIGDNQARIMQDILLNVPGIIAQRGPTQKMAGSATVPFRASGMAVAQAPDGTYKIAVIAGDASAANMFIYAATNLTAKTQYAIPTMTLDPTLPRYRVDAKPALFGGTIVGMSSTTVSSSTTDAGLFLWRGAVASSDVSTTVTANLNVGDTGCTVASGTGITAGMFVFENSGGQYIGTVKSISGTAVTFDTKALKSNSGGVVSSGATVRFQVIRGLNPKAMKGRISTLVTSPVVNGTQGSFGTKFKSQGLDTATGSWDLYRLSDDTFIGTVAWNATTDSNAQITLAANASVGMTNERYYAIHRNSSGTNYSVDILTSTANRPGTVGFLNAQANGLQFYGNRPLTAADADYASRIWVADTADPEGIDLSPDDGDFIDVQSSSGTNTPIIGLQGIAAGLVIFKEAETFLLTGTDATSFNVRKIADIGCLSTSSISGFGNGVIWAAREGIMFYDGSNLRSITLPLGDWWTQSIINFSTASDRAASVVYKNHYILYVDNFASTISLTAGNQVVTPSKLTFVINLDTNAITVWTNVAIKASAQMPSGTTLVPQAVVDDGGSPGVTSLIDINALFTGTGADALTCGGWAGNTGPSFYLETKKYDMGDPERKKLFKQLAFQYILQGNSLSMDVVAGLGTTGTPTVQPWLQMSDYTNARKKFTKRSTHISFRLYPYAWPGVTSTVAALKIGPMAIAFAPQRVGRV